MTQVQLRNQRLSDGRRFYEILNSPKFKYFAAKPKSVEDERKWLEGNAEKRKKNLEYNFSILYEGKLVGGGGIKINQHRTFIGEIGYFVDENYWGKGIATKAAKLMEKFAFKKLGLKRIEILMMPQNIGSEKVAIKCGYKKEGMMKKTLEHSGKYKDCWLYAKVR